MVCVHKHSAEEYEPVARSAWGEPSLARQRKETPPGAGWGVEETHKAVQRQKRSPKSSHPPVIINLPSNTVFTATKPQDKTDPYWTATGCFHSHNSTKNYSRFNAVQGLGTSKDPESVPRTKGRSLTLRLRLAIEHRGWSRRHIH